jgi:spermidine/putrescine transport system substrate-binding protein
MLWDSKYYNAISIKDSMRETYGIGVLKTYQSTFEEYQRQFENGEITEEEYNKSITSIFNSSEQEVLDNVSKELLELKNNIFGFEVDSGKTDIQQGKIAINLAWSGDATYAMDTALEETGTVLKYVLPKVGANIWFDGWVMPKGANVELASKFVDFLSLPSSAVANMDAIGYTPFIACDEIFEYINECYGSSEEDIAENPDNFFEKDLSYFFKHGFEEEPDYTLLIDKELRGTQIDTQYPDEEQLPSLLIMDDFGPKTKDLVRMWEKVKNTVMPAYFYYIVLAGFVTVVGLVIFRVIYTHKRKRDRKERIKARYAARK